MALLIGHRQRRKEYVKDEENDPDELLSEEKLIETVELQHFARMSTRINIHRFLEALFLMKGEHLLSTLMMPE